MRIIPTKWMIVTIIGKDNRALEEINVGGEFVKAVFQYCKIQYSSIIAKIKKVDFDLLVPLKKVNVLTA